MNAAWPSGEQKLAAILGIGTASPPSFTQKQLLPLAARLACRTSQQESWLKRVYQNSGIERRGTVLAVNDNPSALTDFYPPPASPDDRGPTTAQRMARYAEEAPALAEAAAKKALAHSRTPADAITHLITVSCTGFFAPGLDTAMIQRLQLSPALRRQHIGFMGCHGAFNAIAAAREAVLTDEKARVLVCCVELCSLHFAYGWDPGKLVANALFADGAAAVVMGRAGNHQNGNWHLRDTSSFLLPDSSDAMKWRIGDHGFEMMLSPGVPEILRRHLCAWCESWLARHDLRIEDIKSWAIHPGGPKILSAVAEALSLRANALDHSNTVLSRHGNMSSPTVLFILQQIGRRKTKGPCVAIGLGPGLMAEGMLLMR